MGVGGVAKAVDERCFPWMLLLWSLLLLLFGDVELWCCFIFLYESAMNGMVSYAAPNITPEVSFSVEYRVTRASGSKPGNENGGMTPPVP